MIWLTWRQFRAQALAALGAIAALALLFALTGAHLGHLYDSSGLSGCSGAEACSTAKSTFFTDLKANSLYPVLYFAGVVLLYLAPAVIGIFWGAPLVAREVEAGTFRLAWSQSVTRSRWLVVKLGLLGLGAVATAGLLSLTVTWWAGPIDRAAALPGGGQSLGEALPNHFMPLIFGARDLVPIGCAVFAFALGVTAGVLARRLLPAMAVTLLVLAAVQVALPMAMRAHYLAPERTTTALTVSPNTPGVNLRIDGGNTQVNKPVDIPGAWVTSVRTVDAAGRPWNGPAPQICLSQSSTPEQCLGAINQLHLSQVVDYQPADRYWTLQGIETALYLVGAAALGGFCAWRVRSLRLN
ncbi:hypothetical protein ABIA32_001740 [Streptacidiphilus sp. MAP12-20]|uniref:transporter n=1 Tax=Streptacidiphilus sp. MAP12-20 TaxID=3156299 RepID=UPI003514EDA6